MNSFTKGLIIGVCWTVITIAGGSHLLSSKNSLANGTCVRDIFTGETGVVLNQTAAFDDEQRRVVAMPYTFIYRSNDGSLIGQKGSASSQQNKYPAELQPIPCSSANIPFHQ